MPDITMCSGRRDGENCPKAETCHRYTAKPTPGRQSWFQVAPFNPETGECESYWPSVETSQGTEGDKQ